MRAPKVVEAYRNGSAWIRHLLTALPLLLALVAVTLYIAKADSKADQALRGVANNGSVIREHEAEIDALRESQHQIKTDVEVIREKLLNEIDNNANFRRDTRRNLNRILDAVTRPQPMGPR